MAARAKASDTPVCTSVADQARLREMFVAGQESSEAVCQHETDSADQTEQPLRETQGEETGERLVRFEGVGAQKRSWSVVAASVHAITEEWCIRQIKKRGALGSRGIDIAWTSETTALIYVGMFRRVGSLSVQVLR